MAAILAQTHRRAAHVPPASRVRRILGSSRDVELLQQLFVVQLTSPARDDTTSPVLRIRGPPATRSTSKRIAILTLARANFLNRDRVNPVARSLLLW